MRAGKSTLALPANWRDADALALTVAGPDQQELWTSVWPIPALSKRIGSPSETPAAAAPRVEKTAGELRLRAGAIVAAFNAADGILRDVRNGSQSLALSNGPRLTFATSPVANDVQWLTVRFPPMDGHPPLQPPASRRASILRARRISIEITVDSPRGLAWTGYKLEALVGRPKLEDDLRCHPPRQ